MILEAKNIGKSFGKVPALENVSIGLKQGETLALLGESGCGKSTLLRIIAGLETTDSGVLTLAGKTLNSSNIFVKPEHRNIGLVFQDNALFPHLNVRKNIAFGLRRKQSANRVDELLALTHLQGLDQRMPHELSGGQQQRVALARALAPEPDILLLDEPFGTLDHSLKVTIRKEVKAILEQTGKSCILVTHQIDDATAMADRIAVLKEGKLIQTGTAIELYEHPASLYVAALFGEVFRINDGFTRMEHISLNKGSLKALVVSSYYENGRYIISLKHEGQLISAFHDTDIPAGTEICFQIDASLSFE